MTLAFFDFYPIVTRSSSFASVLDQAGFYFLFEKSNLFVLMGYFILSLSPFSRAFSRKHMVYSVVAALGIMLTLALIEKNFTTMRLSDLFMKTAYKFVVIFLGYLILFFIPFFTRRFHGSSVSAAKFRSLKPADHILFLALFFVSSCGFGHLSYIPIILFTFLLGLYLISKSQKLAPKDVEYKLSDGLPLIAVIIIGYLFSFIKVSSIVCNTPFINQYFHCP